jgi:hypothetical protein
VWADPWGLAPECGDDRTRVGRWMGDAEYEKMQSTGYVQEGAGGRTYVAHPANPDSYGRQAAPGTSYVEFDVPRSSLRPGGEPGWAQIPGPNYMFARLAERKGEPIPEMPPATNITRVMAKDEWTNR